MWLSSSTCFVTWSRSMCFETDPPMIMMLGDHRAMMLVRPTAKW